MSIKDPFGEMNLFRLLKDSDGLISYKLYDSGTFRSGSCRYEFNIQGDDTLQLWPIGNPKIILTINSKIPIKPNTVVFVGLYIGDGAKASRAGSVGIVSFSQKEPHLANFVRNNFIELFGESLTFTHRVNEDSLFFMTEEMRQKLTKLREQLFEEGQKGLLSGEALKKQLNRDLESVLREQPSMTRIALQKHEKKSALQKYRKYLVEFFVNRPIMNEYLRRLKLEELAQSGIPLSDRDRIAVNIRLPGVKGAREEGKSSRSDELDVNGLEHFHTLFLRILSDIQSSIEMNKQEVRVEGSKIPWLVWEGKPYEYGRFSLEILNYLRNSEHCKRFSRISPKRYICFEKEQSILLKMGDYLFEVPKTLTITPLLCLFIGLYFAEGQTPKWRIFRFSNGSVGSLNIGFTASEPASISVCMNAMKQLIIGEKGLPEYWRIKVGSKYFPETITIGNKIGAVALRRGEKGQGAASGFEVIESLRDWAIKSIPALKEIESRFDHLEYTGAGIPRVDVFYPKGPEVYLFSLMHDMISSPSILDNYSLTNVEGVI